MLMQWALPELYRYREVPLEFKTQLNFKDRIADIVDVLDISTVDVSGNVLCTDDLRFIFTLHIECTLTLECARTLEPVIYPLVLDVKSVYAEEDSEDVNLIRGNKIVLDDVVFEEIYFARPTRVYKEGSVYYEEDPKLLAEFLADTENITRKR